MMNELVSAAKNSIGLQSLWLEDDQYETMINAVLSRLEGYDEDDATMMAAASSSRLNRVLRIAREIKWTEFGVPAMKDNATRVAMHDLACLMMQDALERKSIT